MSEFFKYKLEKPSPEVGFEREQRLLFPSSEIGQQEERRYFKLLIEGFVEGRPGQTFTVTQVISEVECERHTCYRILNELEKSGLVERLIIQGKGKRGNIGRFRSLAPNLPEISQHDVSGEKVDNDIMDDYFYTIRRGIQDKKARGKPALQKI